MAQANLNPIQLAIVSPCSRCKNQLATSKDGRPLCPRRQAQHWKTELEKQGSPADHIEHLTLTGREISLRNAIHDTLSGPSLPANNDLRNPVYWNEGKTVLIWVATLADNNGLVDAEGKVLCPNLLDPQFIPEFTPFIRCHPVPVVPALPEGAYFTNGGFSEGDHVEVRFSGSQQADEKQKMVLIDGFAQKVHFAFFTPRAPVKKDLVPPGT